jgi:hypothetical protein
MDNNWELTSLIFKDADAKMSNKIQIQVQQLINDALHLDDFAF